MDTTNFLLWYMIAWQFDLQNGCDDDREEDPSAEALPVPSVIHVRHNEHPPDLPAPRNLFSCSPGSTLTTGDDDPFAKRSNRPPSTPNLRSAVVKMQLEWLVQQRERRERERRERNDERKRMMELRERERRERNDERKRMMQERERRLEELKKENKRIERTWAHWLDPEARHGSRPSRSKKRKSQGERSAPKKRKTRSGRDHQEYDQTGK